MKNIVYLLSVIAGFLVLSCDPIEDINAELEAAEAGVVGETSYTLTDDDYEFLDLGFSNFSNLEDARTMIPTVLDEVYPFWGEGSIVNVTYDLFARASTESSLIVYEVTTEDYDANPDTAQFDNFDDEDQIIEFLNTRYPDPESRVLVSLTYDFFDGSVNELNNGFFYLNDEWLFVQGFTDDEYATMGEGFPNFSSEDEAEAKIPIFLLDKFKFDGKEAGDIEPIMYKLFVTDEDDVDGDGSVDDRTTYSYIKNFIFDGNEWSPYNNVIEQSLQFGNDGTSWVPDNTINYTLSGADIAFISDTFIDIYPGPADNFGFFGSFDRRSSSSNYWTDDMLLEAFNALLDNIDPNAEEEQKYVLTYVIYNGATTDETVSLIKTGGVWVRN